ncbi:MAG TPA: DUF3667 domain-containing protein [Chitinophagaceae bacterium]
MSHSKERQEKICLNCNSALYGRYCHICGQQNIEPKEKVWGLVTHFLYDLTHFDGSFFSTLKYLVTRPGFLSAEYIVGRRVRYLNPIRMYIFTSAFFFVIFFSVTDFDSAIPPGELKEKARKDSVSGLRVGLQEALRFADNKKDSDEIRKTFSSLPSAGMLEKYIREDSIKEAKAIRRDSIRRKKGKPIKISYQPEEYKSIKEYDSIQKTLPADERDGWFTRLMEKRQITLAEKYGDDETTIMRVWLNALMHQFPKLLFVSLPIFALILQLLYIRRKQYYYVDHLIFTIHLYIFTFILLLASMGVAGLADWSGWGWLNWLQAVIWIYFLYYNYKAMRNFYRQGRGKTILKFILLNILAQISIVILFVVFFILTAFQL